MPFNQIKGIVSYIIFCCLTVILADSDNLVSPKVENSLSLPALHNGTNDPHDTDSFYMYTYAAERPGKIYPSCKSFLVEFSKQSSDFIRCSIVNARPFRFCEMCADHYMRAMTVYEDIKQSDEKQDNCRKELLLSDRVQIINSVAVSITDIWTRADCKRCFSVLSEDGNGTVTEDLTPHTKTFVALYVNFTLCIPVNVTERNVRVLNKTVCKDCAQYYEAMNNLYNTMRDKEDAPQPVCMDIVDMMNYTRLLWGETLGCTVTHKNSIPVISITIVLLFIPAAFYVGLAVYGTKKHRKVIQDKRLSKFSISNNYGSTESTPLSRSYDITASTSANYNFANSLSDRGHIQQRGNRVISSNRLQDRSSQNSIS